MKKHFFKGLIATAIVALIGYGVSKSVNNSSTEFSELTLSDIEALAQSELGCRNKPDKNDGDCTGDGTSYFCENSWWIHDCVKGSYK